MGLKEYKKIDMITGEILETLVLNDEMETVNDDCKESWSPNKVFYNPVYNFELDDWVEGYDIMNVLRNRKDVKILELNNACTQTIYGRFSHDIDGITYYFSNDQEAQSNFEKADRAFEKGRIASLPWTAYDENGEVIRLLLNATIFDGVYLSHLAHIQNNIAKFRDFLMPQVEAAQTIEEIDSITW